MNRHEVAVDIPSHILRETRHHRDHRPGYINPFQLPSVAEVAASVIDPSYLRHYPNQPFSSPSSTSSPFSHSSSSTSSSLSLSQEENLELESIESDDEGEDEGDDIINGSYSVDGEFDVRVDVIQSKSPEKQISDYTTSTTTTHTNYVGVGGGVSAHLTASAPPLSDDDHENDSQKQEQTEQTEQTKQDEEICVCIICYDVFEQPEELICGRNYTTEELEDIEGKEKISDFCQTCKYDVHHRCLDEYRLNKLTENIRFGYQRGYIEPPDITGTITMNCLMCSKEVETIDIQRNGEINIVKTQSQGQQGRQGQQQQQGRQGRQGQQQQQGRQQQPEEIMQNRMQRRLRRRQRVEFCKRKCCTICFMFLVTITLLTFLIRAI